MKAGWNQIANVALLLLLLALGPAWLAGHASVLGQLDPVWMLERLSVTVGRGETAEIGRSELLQADLDDAAELRHLRLRRAEDGALWLTKLARERRLSLVYEDAEYFADEVVLQDGDTIEIGPVEFRIAIEGARLGVVRSDAPDEELAMLPAPYPARKWPLETMESWQISLGGRIATTPETSGLDSGLERLEFVLRRLIGSAVGIEAKVPALRVPIEQLPENALEIRAEDGRLVASRARGLVAEHCRGERCSYFGRQDWPYSDPEIGGRLLRVIMGRTTYRIDADEPEDVSLVPIERHHWTTQPRIDRDDTLLVDRTPRFDRALAPTEIDGHGLVAQLWDRLFHPPHLAGLIPLAVLMVLAALLTTPRPHRTSRGLVRYVLVSAALCFVVLLPLDAAPVIGPVARNTSPLTLFLLLHLLVCLGSGHWRLPYGAGLIAALALTAMAGLAFAPPDPQHATLDMQYGESIHVATAACMALYLLAGVAVFLAGVRPVLLLFWIALTALVGLGAINGALLAFGADYARFVELFRTHLAVAGLIACAAAFAALWPADRIRQELTSLFLGRGISVVPNWALATGILIFSLLLAGLTFIGEEQGVAGFQPTELSKAFIVIFFAIYLVTLHQVSRFRVSSLSAFWSLAFLGLCFGALMAASVLNFDLSPILIVSMTMGLVLFLWFPAGLFLAALLLRRVRPILVIVLPALLLLVLLRWDVGLGTGLGLAVLAAALLLAVLPRPLVTIPVMPAHVVLARGGRLAEVSLYKDLRDAAGNMYSGLLRRRGRAVFLLALSVVLAGVLLSIALDLYRETRDLENLETFQTRMPDVPAQRIIGWYDAWLFADDPDATAIVRYPDLSLQVRRSREVLAATRCNELRFLRNAAGRLENRPGTLSNDLLTYLDIRMDTLCPSNATRESHPLPSERTPHGAVYSVPALQDDFIATFFVASFGWEITLCAIFLQILLISTMLALSMSCLQRAIRDRRIQGHGLLAAFVIAGFATMLGLQFVLSWANVFGILPVVGQPMTLFSFAGSHHLLFLLPLVISTIVLTRALGHERDLFCENRDRLWPFGSRLPA